MRTIYKYNLTEAFKNDDGEIQLAIPSTAEILTIQTQYDVLCMWVLLDPNHAIAGPRRFKVFGTGWEISEDDKLKYIGTAQQLSGSLVWHVFEVITKKGA